MCRIKSYFIASVLTLVVKFTIADNSVIKTTNGPVKGLSVTLPTGKKLVKFLGVPYAKAGRFEAPRSPSPWNTTLDATKYGKSCPQPANVPTLNIKPEDMSEDCLNLNVFLPNTSTFQVKKASHPVLVMLHGGAFMLGHGAMFDASVLATEGEIVVVTVNYRLGALGFFYLGDYGLNGNYALLDVLEALRWIQRNIPSFGGDPNKVTLGGWSAGARLAGILMTSPLASGLYHKVLLMSGYAGGLFSYLDKDSAHNRGWFFGGLLRCPYPSSDFTNCMKRRSTEEFIKAQAKMYPSATFANWAPVVDGKILPDSPAKLLQDGKFNATPILAGVANDDGSSFLNTIPGLNNGVDISNGMTRAKFIHAIRQKKWLQNETENVEAMIAFQYTDWLKPDDVNVTRRMYLDILTDSMYRAPAIQSVNAFAKRGSAVFFYQFEYREAFDSSGQRVPSWMNVRHGDELRYLFPRPTMSSISGMTKTMVDYWVSFVANGNPDNLGWPEYDTESQKYMAIRGFPVALSHLLPRRMAFWNVYLPKNAVDKHVLAQKESQHRNKSDSVTTALIVVSCLLAILIIAFTIFIVCTYSPRHHKHTSSSANSGRSPRTSANDSNQLQTEKTGPPNDTYLYHSDGKQPNSPLPHYQQKNPDINIEFVDQRFEEKEYYMESDML